MYEQILSFIRTLVQSGAAALAAKRLIAEQGASVLVAFVMWAVPTAWGLWVRRKAGLVASAAAVVAKALMTAVIITTPELAKAVPAPNVVAR